MRIFPAKIRSMEEVIFGMLGREEEFLESVGESPNMYVVSNSRNLQGAGVILYPNLLRDFFYGLKETARGLIILPSSVHEQFGISCLRIVNLFSKICNARMSTRNLTVDTGNLEYIASIVGEKNSEEYLYIIAWGSSMSRCVAAIASKQKILGIIRKACPKVALLQISARDVEVGCQSAIHPLWLKIRNANSEWILEPYLMPKELQKTEKENAKKEKQGEKELSKEVQNRVTGSIYKIEQKKGKRAYRVY